MISCRNITNLLSAFYDGELSAEQARRVEAHLTTCIACRLRYEQLPSVSERMRAHAQVAPSPDFDARVVAAAVAQAQRVTWMDRIEAWLARPMLRLGVSFAVAVMLSAAVAWTANRVSPASTSVSPPPMARIDLDRLEKFYAGAWTPRRTLAPQTPPPPHKRRCPIMAKRFVVPAITTVLVLIVALTIWKAYNDSLRISFIAALTAESDVSGFPRGQPKDPPWERVAQRYPNDWRVQHAWADMAPNAEESIARYDKVVARFPDKAALYAGRVIRYAQIISYGRPEEHWLSGDEAPTNLQKANASDVERAIAAVREGMKVEPDNAFYNYTLAYYLFGLHRDEEALAQVVAGARQPRYDSHVRDNGLNRIHLDKLTQDASLARVTLMASVRLPHCAQERQVARLVTWYAKEAEKKGDHALALERYGQVMRMGAQIRESAGFIIEALVGVAIEAIGRSRGVKRENPPMRLNNDEREKWGVRRQRQIAQEFADYANAHGRADLAAAAWRSMEEGRETRKITQWFMGGDRQRARGVEEPYAGLARYLRIIVGQAALLIQAGLAFLMAIITALLAWRFREKQQVSWLTAFCVAVVCWLPAAVLLTVNCQRVPNPWGWQWEDGPFSPLLFIAAIILPFVLEDLCWGARVVWMRLRPKGTWRFDSPPLLPRTGIMLMLLSLFTYVVLLAPLKKAANDANAYPEKMVAGEMKLAREAWEKATK